MATFKIVGFENHFQKIWNWIMEEKVGILGVTGEGGVGKTTLLRLIYDKLSNLGSHNVVIWVTVSQDFQARMVQDEIWRRIGSLDEKWVKKSTRDKAKCIYDVLSRNKFVLVLDDIWDCDLIDLKNLGIPDPRTQNKSNVILSSRGNQSFSKMGVQRVLKLNGLTDEYAWSLFRMEVGEDIFTSDPSIIKLAKQISNLCSGFPILVLAVAGAMSRWRIYNDWQLALQKLYRYFYLETFPPSLLKFCYDSLPSYKVKYCFLYFSLFPEDFTIPKSDLIDFWISEDFFGHYDSNFSALEQGSKIIDVLIGANLFEEEKDSVKMLDTIRDFALLQISSLGIFYKTRLMDPVSNDKLRAGRISSTQYIIEEIPNVDLDLSTFLLRHNAFIIFRKLFMPELTVLDISNSCIEEIPRGISHLVSLQHLNLSNTCIERLPVELKELKLLKCLNLENDYLLRIIPRRVLSSLSSLQVLRMFHCGFSVQVEEDNILCATYMDLSELQCLKMLKLLSITITCASALKDFFSTLILPSCTHALSLEVFWGSQSLDISSVAAMERLLTFEIHHAELLRNINVNFTMQRSFISLREVNVGKCSNLQDLSWLILAPNLAILRVSFCPETEEIISIKQLGEIWKPDMNLFRKLEVLELESLHKLKSIYWKALPFQFLKKIQVFDCPMLKKLPLSANSAKRIALNSEDVEIIISEEDWLKQVEWEDGATEARFISCVKSLGISQHFSNSQMLL